MQKKKVTIEQILDTAIDLFYREGYHNTSLARIAEECDIKKPSLYHHIPSREALVMKIFEHLLKNFEQNFLQVIYDDKLLPDEKLDSAKQALRTFILDSHHGKLLIKLAYETAETLPPTMELMKSYFATWYQALSQLLTHSMDINTAKQEAKKFFTQLQGAIVIDHFTQDDQMIKDLIDSLA